MVNNTVFETENLKELSELLLDHHLTVMIYEMYIHHWVIK